MDSQRQSLRIKKGFTAWFLVIVVIMGFSLFMLIFNMAWGKVAPNLNESLKNAVPTESEAAISGVIDKTTSTARTFDKLLPFLIIGLFAFVMVMAGMIMKHPIMIFVGIIVLAVLILLSVVYSNVYSEISEHSEFTETKTNMPIQDKFMQYLPYIIVFLAIGITVTIIWSRGGQGGEL